MLEEIGGHIELNRHWAYLLLNHMKFVQRKVTITKSKHTFTNFNQLKKQFLEEVARESD